jgi:hypothetical protein
LEYRAFVVSITTIAVRLGQLAISVERHTSSDSTMLIAIGDITANIDSEVAFASNCNNPYTNMDWLQVAFQMAFFA